MKKLLTILLTIIITLTPTLIHAQTYDFEIEHNLEIKYAKNTDYVTVQIEYIREVKNSEYFFPASGEKTFVIPDVLTQTVTEIEAERKYKNDSLTVKDSGGKDLTYTTAPKEGEGIYVTVPNYKQTTQNSPYKIYISYKTHDYINAVNQNIVIQAPAIADDTEFEITHSDSNTKTKVDYNLDIVVDTEIGELVKIWPLEYTSSSTDSTTTYSFPSSSRIGRNPYIEFGTNQIYRFELTYTTPQTDTLLPEKYSNLIEGLSKNIFEISLPRYFDETNQEVKIENISPTPNSIGRDTEGNIIATFEVNANEQSTISITGYVWVEQNSLEDPKVIPNPTLEEYAEAIGDMSKYLGTTKYWQVNDEYIQQEANSIKDGQTHVIDLIKAVYSYVNDHLEYDQSKADTDNSRIGAKQALQGGDSVCMEYADVMITLLRAQGIPARAALGYANLKDLSHTPESQVRHQWVQVWLPNYGWLSIDPTLESENMDIGQNIDRILWETFNGDDLSNTKIYSADSLDNIDDLQFNISVYAVEENDIDDMSVLKSYDGISPIKDLDESSIKDSINKFFKASSIGRSMAIVAPILLIIIFLIIMITSIRIVIRKIKDKRTPK